MSSADTYDFIVIGSGFGGSVAALRLAEKGYRVAVLEKGKRYRTEDFPQTNWDLRKSIWLPALGLHGTQMLTLLRHVLVLHGGGVGGGSLIYANQLLVPPDEVFAKAAWGPGDWKAKLAPCYAEAQRMLGATPSPRVGKADRVLREIGQELRGVDTFHMNDVGVFFGEPDKTVSDPYFGGQGPDRTGCTFCGACMIGCPVGAKNTLDKNYLHFAERLGVEIVPETEVIAVRPQNGGYEVRTQRSIGRRRPQRAWQARKVVLSAGVIGTLKLLLHCQNEGLLPNLSPQLGRFVRTNSEAILVVRSRDTSVDWTDQIAITSGIYADDTTHVETVRYNKGSDVLYGLMTILTDGGGAIPRQLRFLGNAARHPWRFAKTLWPFGWAERSPVLLVMQTEENHLHLSSRRSRLPGLDGSLRSELPEGANRPPSYIPVANEIAKRMAAKIDGEPMSQWSEVLLDAPTTAHILGGCAMAESPAKGVVGFDGQVFGHPGLYVADGSVVPANLGVNPSLTITALSEHIMSQVPPRG